MLLRSQSFFRPSLLCPVKNLCYMKWMWERRNIDKMPSSCFLPFQTRHDFVRIATSLENGGHPLLHHLQAGKDQIPDNYASTDNNTRKEESKDNIMGKLKRYGVAGVLSYGLLNTVYYLGMFLFAWFYVSPVSAGLGYRAAAERFIKLFALVWAGSQVTKIPRAGCALALAPAIDRGLTYFTDHYKFKSRGQAFGIIVASCVGLALVVFALITFLWA